MKTLNLKVGETDTFKGKKVICKSMSEEDEDFGACIACAFANESIHFCDDVRCIQMERTDGDSVYYEEIKK